MKEHIYIILFRLCSIIFLLTVACWAGYSTYHQYQLNINYKNYHKLQKKVTTANTWSSKLSTESPMDQTSDTPSDHAPLGDSSILPTLKDIPDIDFQTLKKTNPEIYAWVMIPGSSISYPILQHHGQDNYYLHHNLDYSYGYPGCIYSESINRTDFTDSITLLYGHNMKNGSMFGALHQWDTTDFTCNPMYIYIITETKKIAYRVGYSVAFKTDHILSLYANNTAGLHKLLTDMSNIYTPESKVSNKDVSTTEHALILSTCEQRNGQFRRLLIALKEKEWRK